LWNGLDVHPLDEVTAKRIDVMHVLVGEQVENARPAPLTT
jgi:hypothetical protein